MIATARCAVRSTVGSGRPRVAGWSRWRGVVTRTYRGVPLHLLGGPRGGGAAQAGQRLGEVLAVALGAARAAQAGWRTGGVVPVRGRDVLVELDMSGVAAGAAPLPRRNAGTERGNAIDQASVPAKTRVDTGS
ncbi:hypothetical protein CO610_00705 [Lysobacteraceae bacterium NML95-0200]|nr:hypothetical protein CO610_00705 [Xanthomonadaceae bacterium NML95-0200]